VSVWSARTGGNRHLRLPDGLFRKQPLGQISGPSDDAPIYGSQKRFWPERKRIIDELDTAGKLRKAVTLEELKEELLRMPAALSAETGSKETIRNFTILRAIAYIRENFSRKISLEEIAAELSITPEYLSMLFTREIGINYSAFLSEYRISQAKRMLRGTDQKIYEIATQTGFSDTKYFSKVFRDVTGVTPREYRESVRRD